MMEDPGNPLVGNARALEAKMTWLMLLLGVLALGAALLAVDAMRRHAVLRRFPPAGEMITVAGTRLHIVQRGEGRPVVLLHGNYGELTELMRPLIEGAAHDFRVVVPDRPGHGHSERPRGAITLGTQVALLREALAKLGVEQPVVVAHAWSGVLALAWALERPDDLAGLVLLNPLCYADPGVQNTDARLRAVSRVGRLLAPVTTPVRARRAIRASLREKFAPEPVPSSALVAPLVAARLGHAAQRRARIEDFMSARESLPALSARYRELELPLVIVVGDGDRVAHPPRHGYRLHNQVHHSRLVVLEDAGHMIHITRPDAIMAAIHTAWELIHDRATETDPPSPPRVEREFIVGTPTYR
jgi:pimeloyl-ACP methyl ester carboxylesterase